MEILKVELFIFFICNIIKAENKAINRQQLNTMIDLAQEGIEKIRAAQQKALS